MPHIYPVVIPGGGQLVGVSLGFHAYTLRIDNLSNQWLQEESSLAWIPPYSLGTCLRLYGTAVGIILNQAPVNQVQPPLVPGEYAAGFYTDEYRTEVAGVPVRQFTLVQAVSDLTEGPQPALPPIGVCRIWADANGNLFHLHSDGSDPEVWDTRQTFGGVLVGTCPAPGFFVPMVVPGLIKSTSAQVPPASSGPGPELYWDGAISQLVGYNRGTSTYTNLELQGASVTVQAQGGAVAINAATTLTLNPYGGVIPNLTVNTSTGTRQNGIPAGSSTTQMVTALPTGKWLVWAKGMAMNTGAVNDNYQWSLVPNTGGGFVSNYSTHLPNLWNSVGLFSFIDNSGSAYTSVGLQLQNLSTQASYAGDFSNMMLVRVG